MEANPTELLLSYVKAVLIYFQEEGLFQFALLGVATLFSFLLYGVALRYVHRLESVFTNQTVYSTTYKWIKRILLPLIVFFTLTAAHALLGSLQIEADLLALFAPLALSLAIIRALVYALRKTLTPGPMLKAFENLIVVIIWLMVALYLLGWLEEVANILDSVAIHLGNNRFSILTAFQLLIYTTIFIFLALYLSGLIEKQLKANTFHLPINIQVGAAKVIKLALYLFAVLIALNSVGIDLTIFAVFGGALGVGVGFGLQRIASNYISGFILILDRSIKPGDVITIGQQFGTVEKLKGRYIVVRDRDGIETLIPNETLVTSNVVNWSYGDKKIRIKIPVQVSYGDDPSRCMELLMESVQSSPRIIHFPEPVVRLIEFGDNGITLELRVWISDPENGIEEVKTAVYLAIWEKFKQNKITIPFPQRDVHMK